jgi:2-dehydro-3-deoxy-D-gluconate 5-dehydrogenase
MSMFDLTGKKALVTGVGSPIGLGRAMAQGLKEFGAEVVILSRGEGVFDIAKEDGHLAVQADLTNRTDLKRGFNEAVEKLGTLDILLNNHATGKRQEALTLPVETWDLIFETNVTSMFELCQLAGAIMIPKGYGKIINMASMATFFGIAETSAYTASKGAVGQLTKVLASEWSSRGVNVNAIAPGLVETQGTKILKTDPARREFFFQRISCGHFGKAEDMKGAAVYLASHASDYVHGAIIPVDGGWMAR